MREIPQRIRRIFPVLVGVIFLHTLLSTAILHWTLGLPLSVRLLITVALISVLGFLMGIPFPVGVRWAGQQKPGVVPWLWGINGVTSVLGSALATALAIHVGFRVTLFTSAITYSIAGLLIVLEMRRHAAVERPPSPVLAQGDALA